MTILSILSTLSYYHVVHSTLLSIFSYCPLIPYPLIPYSPCVRSDKMTQYDGHGGIINISYQPILTLINMDGDRKLERKLTILLVGRIYEEDDIYKIIRKIIDLF